MFRSKFHSFWHDDITTAKARGKLQRRIRRFLELREDPKDLLFVRSCESTDALPEVEALYAALCACFGGGQRRVLLLVIVEGQEDVQGPILHQRLPGVVFYSQHLNLDTSGEAYHQAVSWAVDAALDVPGECDPGVGFGLVDSCPEGGQLRRVPSGAALIGRHDAQVDAPLLKPCHAALHSGFAGLASFEESHVPHFNLWSGTEEPE